MDDNGMSFQEIAESEPLTPAQEEELLSLALKHASAALDAYEAATTDDEAFYEVPKAICAAYLGADHVRASRLAARALELATSRTDSWNYSNAVHTAYTAKGLEALAAGDIAQAEHHLLNSARHSGSPQLNTFGPSMRLARELLRHGSTEAVLHYLDLCKRFWSSGAAWLAIWETKVRKGEVPVFFMHAFR
jgi:hypothetical protein